MVLGLSGFKPTGFGEPLEISLGHVRLHIFTQSCRTFAERESMLKLSVSEKKTQ